LLNTCLRAAGKAYGDARPVGRELLNAEGGNGRSEAANR